jgi:hypothetical protein
MRDLSLDCILAHKQAQRDAALAAIPEYETVVVYTNVLDAKGAIVKDKHGIPELVEKRLLKRSVVAAEWADKLKPHEAGAHDRY